MLTSNVDFFRDLLSHLSEASIENEGVVTFGLTDVRAFLITQVRLGRINSGQCDELESVARNVLGY